MNDEPIELLDLGERHGVPVVDRWGRSHITLEEGFDLDELDDLSRRSNYGVRALLGEQRIAIPVGEMLPEPEDIARAAALTTLGRIHAEVRGARNGTAIVELLRHEIDEVEVSFSRLRWARTVDALNASLQADWTGVADNLASGTVQVGGHQLALQRVASTNEGPKNALPITVPEGARPSGAGEAVWDAFMRVADATAWTNLATAIDRTGPGLRLALHRDQDPAIELTLANATGGVELFNWWTASADGNRDEALRYILRLVTASRPALPDPRVVLRLAQRQHIALARDNAAEVHRAIAEGQRDTADAMRNATGALGDLIEESARTANATVVAVLGLIALVARSADDLPEWLVGAVALSAVAGVRTVVRSRLSRIDDQRQAIEQLQQRLEDDPMLPEEDRAAAVKRLSDFDSPSRANSARNMVTRLGAAAAGVVVAAAFWLIVFHEPAAPAGSTDTTTSSTPPTEAPAATTTTNPREVSTTTTPSAELSNVVHAGGEVT